MTSALRQVLPCALPWALLRALPCAPLRALLRVLFCALVALTGPAALAGPAAPAEPAGLDRPDLDSPQCRSFPESAAASGDDVPYGQGVLWELRRGPHTHHLFGTIHVSDADIKQLPGPVQQTLDGARTLLVETTLEMQQMAMISSRMFRMVPPDGGLRQQLDPPLFSRMVEILARYQLNEQLSNSLKPWAAYLTMSYPVSADPVILDLHLIHRARARGMTVAGLEDPLEQLAHFEEMPEAEQLQILIDTLCHYSDLEQDFIIMKDLYRARRIGAIYSMVMEDAALMGDPIYRQLLHALVTRRNYNMYGAMQAHLEQGPAFIAVGAMHLPGAEGILSLLVQDGYQARSLY